MLVQENTRRKFLEKSGNMVQARKYMQQSNGNQSNRQSVNSMDKSNSPTINIESDIISKHVYPPSISHLKLDRPLLREHR